MPRIRRRFDYWINEVSVILSGSNYRLDRTAFKAQTAAEAADHASFYKNLSWQERLRIAAYLNSKAFNYPEGMPPRMDKTAFTVRQE